MPSRRIVMAAFYVACCMAIMAVQLTPHDMIPGSWPAPELLLCVTFAWVLRRPWDVPPLLIGAVVLIADLLLQRPPGLGAALTVAASEMLRGRIGTGRPMVFAGECAWVAGLSLAIAIAAWLMLGLTLAPRPDLVMLLQGSLTTSLAYPPTALLLRFAGVRRPLIVTRTASQGGRA